MFSFRRGSSSSFAAGEGAFTDNRFPDVSDRRVIWFELLAYPGEIRVNRVWFYVVAHEDGEKAEIFSSGFNREVMDANKS